MVQLRNFTTKDIDQLIGWIQDEKECFSWAGSMYQLAILKEQLEKDVLEARIDKSKMLLSIWDTKAKKVIGHIQLVEIDLVHKSARIRRVLIGEKTMRNQGVGYDVIKAALDRCFFEWDLNLVTLHVFEYNKNAIACYEKAGFIIDPDGQETRIYKGNEYPLLAMFITRERFYHGNRNRGNQGEDQ